jgi:LysR family transcriptional regulator of abg operon
VKLQTLQALLCIEAVGSLRAAAQQLHTSQPALSAAIQQLETELCAPLLVRTRRGVTLTTFGQAFIKRARLIVAESQRAHDEIRQLRGHWEGQVSFSTSPAVGLQVLPKALASFAHEFPKVTVRVRDGLYPAVAAGLRDGSLDFALTAANRHDIDEDLECEALFVSEVVIVARKGHPLSHARHLHELQDCAWVYSSAPRGPGAVIEEAFRSHALPPAKFAMACESFLVLPGIISQTDWLTTMPLAMYERNALQDGLCRIEVEEPLRNLTIYALRRHDMPLTPASESLIRWVRHFAAQR